ncbi:MAG: lysostaphin resistance A-like protein [Acutalibacteraceae bacterium]
MENSNLNTEAPENEAPRYEEPGVTNAPKQTYITYVPYGFTPKTYEEKRGIRKAALLSGLSVISIMVISSIWGAAYFFIMTLLGFPSDKSYEIVTEPAVLQVVQILLSSFMFTVPFIIIFKAGGQRISDLVPIKKPTGNKTAMFFIGLSFCAFANIASSYCGYFFESIGIDYNVDLGDNPGGFFGFLLCLISTAIVPALVEEFACRGLILGIFRKYGDSFAVLASAILFGLMHGNFDQMPFAFLVGLALGYIVVKTESLWIAVAVHAANNFISVAFNFLLCGLSQNAQNLIYTLYLMAALTAGIIAAVAVSDKDAFIFKRSDTESSFKQKNKWFFSSAVIIIFIILCLGQAITYF